MIFPLRPPVRARAILARERYNDVRVRVPVRDGRGATHFVCSRANQHRDCKCIDGPPQDVCHLCTFPFVARLILKIAQRNQTKNSNAPVSKLYIAPVILIVPPRSNSVNTALFFRILSTVIWTLVRATASTKA